MSNTTSFGYLIPTARKVSPLRQRMIEDMTVRNFAPNTQQSYLGQVGLFARHFGKSPEQLGPEDIRTYQKRDWTVPLIPGPKKDHRLPVILSPQEVLEVLQAAPSFPHHVIFSTMYGTGMRVSEAVHLRADNIDSQRMMIRIELSKGHKDRDVQLSPKLLELLRCYWRKVRPGEWMFPGQNPHQPLSREAVGDAVVQASRRAGLTKHTTPHSMRHAYAVHLLEAGTDIRKIQLLLGHRSLSTTARYLRLATTTVCATTSPLDLLPLPIVDPKS